jgi:hypothetical protein
MFGYVLSLPCFDCVRYCLLIVYDTDVLSKICKFQNSHACIRMHMCTTHPLNVSVFLDQCPPSCELLTPGKNIRPAEESREHERHEDEVGERRNIRRCLGIPAQVGSHAEALQVVENGVQLSQVVCPLGLLHGLVHAWLHAWHGPLVNYKPRGRGAGLKDINDYTIRFKFVLAELIRILHTTSTSRP